MPHPPCPDATDATGAPSATDATGATGTTDSQPEPRRLTELAAGERGRLLDTELEGSDLDLLRALGFAERAPFRLCKVGNPWIVQVRGTRIGLSDAIATRLRVLPEAGPHT